jgi:hypothetical protein
MGKAHRFLAETNQFGVWVWCHYFHLIAFLGQCQGKVVNALGSSPNFRVIRVGKYNDFRQCFFSFSLFQNPLR